MVHRNKGFVRHARNNRVHEPVIHNNAPVQRAPPPHNTAPKVHAPPPKPSAPPPVHHTSPPPTEDQEPPPPPLPIDIKSQNTLYPGPAPGKVYPAQSGSSTMALSSNTQVTNVQVDSDSDSSDKSGYTHMLMLFIILLVIVALIYDTYKCSRSDGNTYRGGKGKQRKGFWFDFFNDFFLIM